MEPATIKVKPWGEGQGDHVIINADDFDPKVHTAFDELADPLGIPASSEAAVAKTAKVPRKQRRKRKARK